MGPRFFWYKNGVNSLLRCALLTGVYFHKKTKFWSLEYTQDTYYQILDIN